MASTHLTLPVPVLILEDDAVMQQRLEKILVELGYQTEHLLFCF